MGTSGWKILWTTGLLLAAVGGGCQKKDGAKTGSPALTPSTELGATIGSLAEVVKPEPVAVEGYGLVGGLAGTGSGYCPPEVRAYLKRYILTQLPDNHVNVDALIDSKDTAVVVLEAEIGSMPSMDEHFDVRVSLLPGSDATSLQGGWLYGAELAAKGTLGAATRSLATVKGPVFLNPIGTADLDPRSGYILGGGRTLYAYKAMLRLRRPNFTAISLIRNRLSERYGPNIAQALSPGLVEVSVPDEYRRRKMRFIAVVQATFLEVTNELNSARIDAYVQQLAASADKEGAEIALEAVGRESAGKLSGLLTAPEAEVRLRAARCMLSLHDGRGLAVLRDIALDPRSPHRLEALEAVSTSDRRVDAVTLAQRLLRDEDVAVVLAAYDDLRQIDERVLAPEDIGRSFRLEQVVQSSHKAIFVSRSGDPRIVLFGSPLRCRDSLFVESPDQTVTLDSRAGQGYVSVIRKHPTRPGVMGPVRSKPEVGAIVRILGGEAEAGSAGRFQSLGVSYSQVITLLEQMCAKDAVAAQFWAGPLPKIGPAVKK